MLDIELFPIASYFKWYQGGLNTANKLVNEQWYNQAPKDIINVPCEHKRILFIKSDSLEE